MILTYLNNQTSKNTYLSNLIQMGRNIKLETIQPKQIKGWIFTSKILKISIEGLYVSWSNYTNHLCVLLDKNLTFDATLRRQLKSDLSVSILNRKIPIPTHSKILTCRLYFRSILLYASIVWGPHISCTH